MNRAPAFTYDYAWLDAALVSMLFGSDGEFAQNCIGYSDILILVERAGADIFWMN